MILLCSADRQLRRAIAGEIEKAGWGMLAVTRPEHAAHLLEQRPIDVLLVHQAELDSAPPKLIRWARQRELALPIIVLCPPAAEAYVVSLLDQGADDVVTTPLNMEVFMARLRRSVQRKRASVGSKAEDVLEYQGLRVYPRSRHVEVGGEPVRLSRTEYLLLEQLMRKPDVVQTYQQLISGVWGLHQRANKHYVHIYMRKLKAKLGPSLADFVAAVPGVGYRLVSGPGEPHPPEEAA